MKVPEAAAPADLHHRVAVAGHFDAAYYLAANPSVRIAEQDPLDHFLLQGWLEGRNPSRIFDVRHYLSTHVDVAATGLNPLVHYAWVGQSEGRSIQRPLCEDRRQLAASSSPRSRIANWLVNSGHIETLPPALLASVLTDRAGREGLIVSVSHDDYAVNYGGIQNLIADEQAAFAAAGWSYLHLSPGAPLPMLADAGPAETFVVRLRLDGVSVGTATMRNVILAVASLHEQGARLEMIIHHLMGHAPEHITALATAVPGQGILWVHDYFTLCPSYALMRNDIRFCCAPSPHSAACTICTFGDDRLEHLSRMRAFFQEVHPWVLAPSAVALNFWLRRGTLPHAGAEVVPLARLIMAPLRPDPAEPNALSARLRVAHLGARVTHKGWSVFEALALDCARDCRYEFYHLGDHDGPPLPGCIQHVPVRVDSKNRRAMIEAVAEHRIDVVVSWSLWPETFCFALHEALAGGAFVIARTAAGNVWPAVAANAPDQGCSVEDALALTALFRSGGVVQRVSEGQRRFGALLLGGGTADWLNRGPVPPTVPQAMSRAVAANV